MGWLKATSLLGAPRWLLLALLGVALAWAAASFVKGINRHDQDQRDAGAAQQRADDLGETVNRVEKANEVRDQINDPRSNARYDECLRSARAPENCQRFLPQ
jgi:hypothetical protein